MSGGSCLGESNTICDATLPKYDTYSAKRYNVKSIGFSVNFLFKRLDSNNTNKEIVSKAQI